MSSLESVPVIPFWGNGLLCKEPLYLAYNQYGPGHYDSTMQLENETDKSFEMHKNMNEEKNEASMFCRCGSNKKKSNEAFVACVTNTDSQHKSRCKCYQNKIPCTKCDCANCGNSFNEKSSLCDDHALKNCVICKTIQPSIPRKRVKSDYCRKSSKAFMEDINESVQYKGWTLLETAFLESVVSQLPMLSLEPTTENISLVYNSVITDKSVLRMGLAVSVKSTPQIVGKMNHRGKIIEACLRQVAHQMQIVHSKYD